MADGILSTAFELSTLGQFGFGGPGSAAGGLLGLNLGFSNEIQEEQERASESLQATQIAAETFKARQRAQRLSLLSPSRRFEDGSDSQPSGGNSALSVLTENDIFDSQQFTPSNNLGTF